MVESEVYDDQGIIILDQVSWRYFNMGNKFGKLT